MSNQNLIKIISEAAEFSVTRIKDTYRYSALTINLIPRSTRNDYDISHLTKICIDLNVKDHRLTKKDFKLWVLGNCLSQMIESFTMFVNKGLEICYQNSLDSSLKDCINNDRSSINKKLEKLTMCIDRYIRDKKNFSKIDDGYISAIKSIKEARNCIIHYQGIVSKRFVNNKNIFTLEYFYIKDYAVLDNGRKIDLKKAKRHKNIVDYGSTFGHYEKKFKINTSFCITSQELYRIGIFIEHLILNLTRNIKILLNI